MQLKIQQANLSDIGKKRTANEDYYGFFEINKLKIFIVSDGMGGYKGGALASHIVVDTVKEHFESNCNDMNDISGLIKEALVQSDKRIKEKADSKPDLKEMGATAVILVIKDDKAYIAHIGDSRIYLIRDNQIRRLTKDHSLVQQMLDGGLITEELAKNHPNRNVITHSLGYGGKSEPEIQSPFQLYRKDVIILCTDGLTGHVDDDEIREICLKNESVTAVYKLIDLANERGGKDNITVQLIKVLNGKRRPLSHKVKKQILNSFLYALIPLFALLLTVIAFYFFGLFDKKGDRETKREVIKTLTDSVTNTKLLEKDSLKKVSDSDTVVKNLADSLYKGKSKNRE